MDTGVLVSEWIGERSMTLALFYEWWGRRTGTFLLKVVQYYGDRKELNSKLQ